MIGSASPCQKLAGCDVTCQKNQVGRTAGLRGMFVQLNSQDLRTPGAVKGAVRVIGALRFDHSLLAACRRSTAALLVPLLFCLLCAGCGYRVGHGFEPEIHSVYIPIFTSQSDRRGLEFQLTEAVQKEVQLRTPFRIVEEPAADTQLIGKIVSTRKRVLGETRYDDPRELQMSLTVEVRWENLKTGEILAQKSMPLSENEIQLIQRSEFAPEVGQSLATSYQQLTDRMARDIVDMMEAPTL